jgi:hypothetical protein
MKNRCVVCLKRTDDTIGGCCAECDLLGPPDTSFRELKRLRKAADRAVRT